MDWCCIRFCRLIVYSNNVTRIHILHYCGEKNWKLRRKYTVFHKKGPLFVFSHNSLKWWSIYILGSRHRRPPTTCHLTTILHDWHIVVRFDLPRSSKVNDFHIIWKPMCNFLLVTNSNLGAISHRLATIHPWQTTDRQTTTRFISSTVNYVGLLSAEKKSELRKGSITAYFRYMTACTGIPHSMLKASLVGRALDKKVVAAFYDKHRFPVSTRVRGPCIAGIRMMISLLAGRGRGGYCSRTRRTAHRRLQQLPN